MRDANTDIMCIGHTHKPYHRVLEDEENGSPTHRHAVNLGSVGKPKDGGPQGCYVLPHIDENTSKSIKDSVKVELVRFGYYVEKAAKAVEESILPNTYALELKKAKCYDKK